MRCPALILPAVLLAIGPVRAQDREINAELRARIDDAIREMRAAIEDGVPIITNVRVGVKLRNGNKLSGVVKQGRFIEKVDGLDFTTADLRTPGAGLRVWYYNHTNSYIFLPFEAVSSYKIGARLTDVQVKEIEDRIESERARADEARRALLAKAMKGEGEASGENGQGVETAEQFEARLAEEERLFALLEEFPPEEGWGQEKLNEIQVRKITVGAFPDERSQRFVEVFSEWEEAHRLKTRKSMEVGDAARPKPPAGMQGGTELGSGDPARPMPQAQPPLPPQSSQPPSPLPMPSQGSQPPSPLPMPSPPK
ncbi:MAG: hypothetical protein AAF628_13315 [Planctomycetota bacterium]